MIESFVDTKVLGKSKAISVVLVHGLFANSAFWLPYLGALKHFRVVLVNIDYVAMFGSGCNVEKLARHLDNTVGVQGAHLIGHSFGSCVGREMRSALLSRSFICPTFAAKNFYSERFRADICGLTGLSDNVVRPVVDYAIAYKSAAGSECDFRRDSLYLPLDDPYFDYAEVAPEIRSHRFHGGHFNLHEAFDEMLAADGRLRCA